MAHLQVRSPQELAIKLGDGHEAEFPGRHLLKEAALAPAHFKPPLRRIPSRPAHDPRYVAAES